MGIFDNAVSVVIGNKIVQSIVTSDNGVIYERAEHTRLSIDVPLNLTYSDAFNISGNLTASDGSTGISGEEVVLKVDGNVMDSVTTGNNGEYSFTQTPVSSGNHTFQVVYAGSNTYGSSESSTVTRTVGKETTIITATVDQTKYDIGDTITVTATLTDDEGNAITGLSRKVVINGYYPDNLNIGVAKGYMTPTNDGHYTFSFTYVNATQSGVRVSVTFDGDSNYTSSSSSIIDLNIVTPTLITATANNPTITDGGSSTITATLLDQDGDAIPNRTLSYVVKHGNDTISTGSDTTDSNGEIDISYTGGALGQIDIVMTCGNATSTYTVIDAIYYDDCINADTTSRYSVNTADGNSLTHTSNGMVLEIGSARQYVALDTNQPSATLSDYLGKTITFKANVNPSRRCALQLLQVIDGSNNLASSDWTTTEDTLTVTSTIDSTATRIQFRVLANGTGATSGDTVNITDFTIYEA